MEQSKNGLYRSKWIDILVYLAVLVFYLLYFRLICNSGMSADDMWNSNVWSSTYTGQEKAWYVVMHQMPVWLHMGRFFPFSNLAPVLYMMLPSVFLYKLAIVIATYLDNLICSLCVRSMTGERILGYIYILLFPVLIQITPEYDSGLYCYHMLIQSVVLFGFLSVWGLMKYMETDRKRYAILSALAFFIALGTYEVGFVFILLLVYVAWVKIGRWKNGGWKELLRYLLPDLIVFVLMCFMNVLVRILFQTATYDGIAVKLDVKAILITLLKQCSTCIPLGRYICAGIRELYPYSDVYIYSIPEIFSHIEFTDVITMIVFLILFVCIARWLLASEHSQMIDKKKSLILIISGAIIWLVPGVLIAISSKYQQLLGWCSGHLPAYMQSLGFAMLIAGIYLLILCYMKDIRGRWAVTGICGIISVVILLISQVEGREAVEFMNGFRKYPQDNIAHASEAGIFDDLIDREDRVIVGTTCYIYDMSSSRQFYTKFAKKNLYARERQSYIDMVLGEGSEVPYTVMENSENGAYYAYDLTQMDQEYYGVFNMADKNSGALILGRYAELDYSEENQTIEHMWIQDPVIYIRGDGLSLVDVDTSEWILEREASDYKIYRIYGLVDILQESRYYDAEWGKGRLYRN